MSKWQGDINWVKVAGDGVKFAMIRLGAGDKNGAACNVDLYYEENVKGALANGIAVGCYFYSYALSVAEAKREAAFVIAQLAKYKGRILYPIAFDIEDATQSGLGKPTLTAIVTAFCSAIEAAGYYASFYCNKDWAQNKFDMAALSRFDLWLAQWASAPTYNGRTFNMWQSSSGGTVAGISTRVDLDTAFVDYEALIKSKKLNGYAGSPVAGNGGNSMTDRQTLVNTAATYIGTKEANGGHRKIIDMYNAHKPLARSYKVKYTDAWCATFVSAMAIKCGLTGIIPTECGCGQMIELFKKLGAWQESDAYTPQPGDIIFYDWDDTGRGDNTGWPEHVGIVESVSGAAIKVIEGNISNAVGRRNIAVNARNIRGYGLPKYKGATGGSPAVTSPVPAPAAPAPTIKVGSAVRITGSTYSTGQKVPDWVKKQTHKVSQISGAKALLGSPGGISSWVNLSDLALA